MDAGLARLTLNKNTTMKRIGYCLAVVFALALAACGNAEQKNASTGADTVKAAGDSAHATTYTCPMHPEVISDKPGKCPTCGMDLEAKS